MNELNSSVIEIEFLADCTEVIPRLVEWAYGQWRHEGVTRDFLREEYQSFCRKDGLALSLVALAADDPVGVVSLKLREMTIHRDKPHWLGVLFVAPRWRDRGIGSSLVRRAMSEAQRLGVRELCLHTSSHSALYARAGFEEFEQREYEGEPVTIMTSLLTGEQGTEGTR